MSVPPRSTALVMDVDERRKFSVVSQLLHQHFRIGDDDPQHIVEIVRDAAGKASDGFHFLHVAKSLLDSPDVGDVFGDHFKIKHLPLVIPHGAPADLNGNNLAVFLFPMRFQLGELLSRAGLIEHERGVLTLFENIGCQVQRQQFLGGFVSEHFHQRVVDHQQFAFRRRPIDAVGAFDHGAEIGFGLAQGVIHALAFGDVADRAGNQNAFVRLLGTQADFHGKFRAVFLQTVQFAAGSHGAGLRIDHVIAAMRLVVVPESFRNEHLHGLAEEFFALVSEQFFGLRVDQDDSPVVSGDHHGVRRGIEQTPQAFFDALAIRNVADRGANERTVCRLNGTETDLDRELGLVFAEAEEFEARSHGPHLRVAHETGAVAAVPAPQSFRH